MNIIEVSKILNEHGFIVKDTNHIESFCKQYCAYPDASLYHEPVYHISQRNWKEFYERVIEVYDIFTGQEQYIPRDLDGRVAHTFRSNKTPFYLDVSSFHSSVFFRTVGVALPPRLYTRFHDASKITTTDMDIKITFYPSKEYSNLSLDMFKALRASLQYYSYPVSLTYTNLDRISYTLKSSRLTDNDLWPGQFKQLQKKFNNKIFFSFRQNRSRFEHILDEDFLRIGSSQKCWLQQECKLSNEHIFVKDYNSFFRAKNVFGDSIKTRVVSMRLDC